MAADGSIVIEANLEVSQAEKNLKRLEDEIKTAEETIEKGGGEELSEQISKAKEKAGELRKVMVGAAKIEFAPGYSKEVTEYIDSYSKNLSSAPNEMKKALEDAALIIKDLEKQGKWFGDEDYDAAIKQFERTAGDIAEYKKSLLSPEKPENPFGLYTIAGKVREAEIALERLKSAGKGLGDTEYDEAYRSLSLLKDEARQYAAELSKTPAQAEREAGALAKAAKKAEEAAAKEQQAAAEAARLQGIRENAVISNQAVVRLNQELQTLKIRLNDLKNAGIGPGYEEYDKISARVQEINSQLKGIQSQTTTISGSASKMGAAMERAKKSAEGFATRLKGVVTSALVFTVVSQGLAKFREWMGKVIQTNDEASAAMARLRGSLLTLAQPLVNVLIPAFTTLVNVLTRIVSIAAQIVSSLFGTTVEQSAEAAENLYNESNAIEDVSGAAKKAGKSLAGFDEINQLSGDQPSGGAGGGVSAGGTAPDFTGPINDSLTGIVELFTGAALLALGAILTFSGAHILLGIGLMVLGALAIWDAVSTNWNEIAAMLQGPLGILVGILSAAALVIGAILTFSGANILLGIGLMAFGAIGLATIASVNWDTIVAFVQENIDTIAVIVGAALLVLGAILTFSGGGLALGIGLLAAGAIILATEAAVNWDTIENALKGPIGTVVAIVSGALLVLGAILCFSGAGIPLGIALMAAGAIGLVTTASVNWNTIVEKIKEVLGQITNAVTTAWNWLDDFTHGFLSDIFGAFDEIFGGLIDFIAGVFSGDWERAWEGVKSIFQGIWDGLIAIAKAPINAIIGLINGAIDAINWIIDGINSISFDMPDWLGGAHIGFSIGKIGKIPYLAQGAVIPPNREFLAVLGDQRRGNNIEAPEGLLRQLIREESGGSEVVVLLKAILEATRAGKKLYVDKKVLAQTAKDGINDMTIAAGRSVLLY